MPSFSTLAVFAVAALALLLVPGPSVLFIVTKSLDHGRRGGLLSVLGTHAGTLLHVTAAAAGLSAIVVSSAVAFSVVKYVGAGYLVVLAVRRWRAGDRLAIVGERRPMSPRQLFRDGFVVSVLNPKTAIFFLAFLPQFVEPGRGAVGVQVIALGLTYIALGLVTDSTYALAASAVGRRLRVSIRARRIERYLSSGVHLGLGVTTATQPA